MFCAAFARIARGDDERSRQAIDRGFHFADGVHEPVESQFKKVGRLSHPEGALEISAGKNYADDLRRHFGCESRRSRMRSTYFASRTNLDAKSAALAWPRFVCWQSTSSAFSIAGIRIRNDAANRRRNFFPR